MPEGNFRGESRKEWMKIGHRGYRTSGEIKVLRCWQCKEMGGFKKCIPEIGRDRE